MSGQPAIPFSNPWGNLTVPHGHRVNRLRGDSNSSAASSSFTSAATLICHTSRPDGGPSTFDTEEARRREPAAAALSRAETHPCLAPTHSPSPIAPSSSTAASGLPTGRSADHAFPPPWGYVTQRAPGRRRTTPEQYPGLRGNALYAAIHGTDLYPRGPPSDCRRKRRASDGDKLSMRAEWLEYLPDSDSDDSVYDGSGSLSGSDAESDASSYAETAELVQAFGLGSKYEKGADGNWRQRKDSMLSMDGIKDAVGRITKHLSGLGRCPFPAVEKEKGKRGEKKKKGGRRKGGKGEKKAERTGCMGR